MTRKTTRKQLALIAGAASLAMFLGACGGSDTAAPPAETTPTPDVTGEATPPAGNEELDAAQNLVGEYPRNETVFTSGGQWGPPSSWNIITESGIATGTKGLCYETLMHFDPNTLKFSPWLAEEGKWVDDSTYQATIRDKAMWSDGTPLTASDVKFTWELGKRPGVPWQNLWTWTDSVEADDAARTVTWHFSQSRPQEFENNLYMRAIIPEHIVKDWTDDALLTSANEKPICSGPFNYSTHGQDRMVWERNDAWWGVDALGMNFPMRFVVDIVNPSNEVALGLLMQGQLDLSNNFLPGVQQLVASGQVKTYFPEAPYMLSANTSALYPNTTKFPTNDVNFRQALAHAIDIDTIVGTAYGNLVKASNPTGMLPPFDEFVDQAAVSQYGFTYDIEKAKQILAENGYVDVNNDGYVEGPNGEPIDVEIIVPAGWTDWMDAQRVIVDSAAQAGIKLTANTPDAGAVDQQRQTGNFDLVINNFNPISNTPWTWYNWVFSMPIQEQMFTGNFGRFDDGGKAWDLVNSLAQAPSGSPEFKSDVTELQTILMQELPNIPMWYNGLWAQYSEGTWTNWPTAGGESQSWPCTWNGYWELGGLETLANLRLAH